MIEVKTQAQLEKALKKTNEGWDDEVIIVTNGRFVVESGTPRIVVWEQSSPRMESWGQSSPRMVSRGQSSPTMVSREQSSPRMESWEQSSPRMVSWEQSSPTMVSRGQSSPTMVSRGQSSPRMESWGQSSPRMESWEQSSPRMVSRGQSSVTGKTGKYSQPRFWRHDDSTIKISGAVILEPPKIETAADWCEFHGVEIRKGGGLSRKLAGQDVAILFKAVSQKFVSSHGCSYEPGSTPEAPDWDGGKQECGGGLHFSPHPVMAEEFHEHPDHFVACPVLVSEIVVHPGGIYPQKIKAPRVCAPCWEVDRDGERAEAS